MLECRAAQSEEFEHAAEMRARMSAEHGTDFDSRFPQWRQRYCAHFGAKQARGDAQLFLAFDAQRPVGMAIVSLLENYRTAVFGTRVAYVNGVFVYPEYRRRGIARRLMELAIEWARERGCLQVRLRASEQGRPLYSALGFVTSPEMQLEL